MPTKKKAKKKTEAEKLQDFGKFVADINNNINETIARGRKKMEAQAKLIEPLPDAVAAMLGLRPQTKPTAGQSAKKPTRKATVRRKNGTR